MMKRINIILTKIMMIRTISRIRIVERRGRKDNSRITRERTRTRTIRIRKKILK
jgi:hypothetical protein